MKPLGAKRGLLALLNAVFCAAALHLLWRGLADAGPVDVVRISGLVVLCMGSGMSVLAWLTGHPRVRLVAIGAGALALSLAAVALWRLWGMAAHAQLVRVLFPAAVMLATFTALVRDHQAAREPRAR